MVDSTMVTHQSDPDRFPFRAGFTTLVPYSIQVKFSKSLVGINSFLSFCRLAGIHFAYCITYLVTQKNLFQFEQTIAIALTIENCIAIA